MEKNLENEMLIVLFVSGERPRKRFGKPFPLMGKKLTVDRSINETENAVDLVKVWLRNAVGSLLVSSRDFVSGALVRQIQGKMDLLPSHLRSVASFRK